MKGAKLPNGLSQANTEEDQKEEMEKAILGLIAIKGS